MKYSKIISLYFFPSDKADVGPPREFRVFPLCETGALCACRRGCRTAPVSGGACGPCSPTGQETWVKPCELNVSGWWVPLFWVLLGAGWSLRHWSSPAGCYASVTNIGNYTARSIRTVKCRSKETDVPVLHTPPRSWSPPAALPREPLNFCTADGFYLLSSCVSAESHSVHCACRFFPALCVQFAVQYCVTGLCHCQLIGRLMGTGEIPVSDRHGECCCVFLADGFGEQMSGFLWGAYLRWHCWCFSSFSTYNQGFSIELVSFTLPGLGVRLQLSISSPTLGTLLLNFSHFGGCVVSHCGFNLHFPVITDAKQLCTC